MTSYSVLASGTRGTILATWPDAVASTSVAVTTLPDPDSARHVADLLTSISESAWDAAAFHDVSAAMEAAIAELAAQLGNGDAAIETITVAKDGYRHVKTDTCAELEHALRSSAQRGLAELTRAQRIAIADELTVDAAARARALTLLPTGCDPEADGESRIWQMCTLPHTADHALRSGLPDESAAWITHNLYDPECSPAVRWGMRDKLVRLEQLHAACIASGGRGRVELDEYSPVAHLVMPSPTEGYDSDIFYVRPKADDNGELDAFAPLIAKIHRSAPHGQPSEPEIIELSTYDDEAFAELLGDWTRNIPGRVIPVIELTED